MKTLPLLTNPEALLPLIGESRLLILDTSRLETYNEGHIPGAIHIPPQTLQSGIKPATGKLPDIEHLNRLFSSIGLTSEHHVVAYDDEGGGWAGRLLWTLAVIGHNQFSYLDGGIHTWRAAGNPLQTDSNVGTPNDFIVPRLHTEHIAEVDDIVTRLGDDDFAIWDARSKAEFDGTKSFALRPGHIPGATWYEWTDLMDRNDHLKLLPLKHIQQRLNQLGLTSDKDIVTHCQSHHRSGLTWLVATILGYPSIRAYHGSWGEWGNLQDTPVATNLPDSEANQ